ncbi:MAG TPA: hypothetical protein VNS60_09000 [Solirubrobacterales bacterium]|nr:hypothetical protein [Solirubrobacterales bacterium]
MARRACVFCGSKENKISKEDVWPLWLRKVVEGGEGEMFERARIHTTAQGETVSHLRWPEAPIDWQVSGPCESCNNGWMSQIENEAKPILAPMVQHQEQTLGPIEQETLARWATLRVLMGQHGHPKEKRNAIPEERYHRFFEAREMPNCQIWIARRNGEGAWPTDYHHRELFIELVGAPEPTAPNAYVTAFAVGHVAFICWGSQFKKGPTVDVGDNMRPFLLPIWPDILPVRWPPDGVLGPNGLEAVARNLSSPRSPRT